MTSLQPENYSTGYRWYVVLLMMCVYACNYADRTLLSVLLEPIKAEFGASDTTMGFVGGTLFSITYSLFTVPMGWTSDRVNRRKFLAGCLVLWSVMTTVTSMARSIVHVGMAQVFVAFAESGSPPTMSSIISDLFSRKKRGFPMAVWFTGVSIGIFIGYALGGYLAEILGWRAVFLCLGVPGVLLAILLYFSIRDTNRGMADGNAGNDINAPGFAETRQFVFAQRALLHTFLGTSIGAASILGSIYWLPAFFSRSHNLGLSEIGFVIGIIMLVTGVIAGPLGGLLMDRLGRKDLRWHGWLNCVLLLLSLAPMLILFTTPSVTTAYIACTTWLFCTTAVPIVSITLINNLAAAQFRGVVMAIGLLLLNLIGYGLGTQVIGILSDWLANSWELGQDSLRYACALTVIFPVWACYHFWQVARNIKQGYETAAQWEKATTEPEAAGKITV